MVEKVRGKFFVLGKKKSWAGAEADDIVELGAVYKDQEKDSENTYFNAATPFGEIKMQISNKAAAGFFNIGDEVYVDFTHVTPKPA